LATSRGGICADGLRVAEASCSVRKSASVITPSVGSLPVSEVGTAVSSLSDGGNRGLRRRRRADVEAVADSTMDGTTDGACGKNMGCTTALTHGAISADRHADSLARPRCNRTHSVPRLIPVKWATSSLGRLSISQRIRTVR
jgi:hypothetical protein